MEQPTANMLSIQGGGEREKNQLQTALCSTLTAVVRENDKQQCLELHSLDCFKPPNHMGITASSFSVNNIFYQTSFQKSRLHYLPRAVKEGSKITRTSYT